MEENVDSADKATELAIAFLKKHYSYTKPVKATREQDIWTVEVDVGLLSVQIAKVRIDAKKSSIIEYSIPVTSTTAKPAEPPLPSWKPPDPDVWSRRPRPPREEK